MAKPETALPPARTPNWQARMQPPAKPKDLRGTLTRLWQLVRPQTRGLGWVFLLSVLSCVAAMATPKLVGSVINAINTSTPFTGLLLVLCGLYLGDWLVKFLSGYWMAGLSQRMTLRIRTALFDHITTLPLRFFDTHPQGDLMSRLTNDIDNISTTLCDSLTQLFVLVITIVGVLSLMLSTNLLLTAVALISAPLVYILTKIITKRTRALFRGQQSLLGQLNGTIEEGVWGLETVLAFGREGAMIERFSKANDDLRRVATRAQVWSGYLMPLMNVINNLCFIAVAVTGGLLSVRQGMDVGTITTFLLYARQLTRPLNDIAALYNGLLTAVAGAERVFEIMDEAPEPADAPDAVPLPLPLRGEIVFANVTFGYLPGKPVLRGLSLTIPAGAKVALVGATGAGKTTVINLLPRLYDIQGGRILLDGRDITTLPIVQLRSLFGIVLQDPSLFDMTVAQNLRYGSPDADDEQLHQAAEAALADAVIRRLPGGYDARVSAGATRFSQGERQLLTIARAMLTDAPIMIFDEATSNVDTRTERAIQAAMHNLTRNRTSVFIAHRLSTIRDCDIIFVLSNGTLAESGTHEELMAKKGLYASMNHSTTGA